MSETDAPHAGFHCDDFPLAIGQDEPALGELSLLRVDSRRILEVTDLGLPLNSWFTAHPEVLLVRELSSVRTRTVPNYVLAKTASLETRVWPQRRPPPHKCLHYTNGLRALRCTARRQAPGHESIDRLRRG